LHAATQTASKYRFVVAPSRGAADRGPYVYGAAFSLRSLHLGR